MDGQVGPALGVDVGEVRVGVAESDPEGLLATPVCTLEHDPGPEATDRETLAALVAARGATTVYVGLPRSLSGQEGPAARRARAYAAALAARVAPTRVRLVDERLTTVSAHRQLRDSGRAGRDHRAVVDQAAAVLILQGALDAWRATGRAQGELVRPDGRKPRTKDRG
jgi:putative Holliday junction resolvase